MKKTIALAAIMAISAGAAQTIEVHKSKYCGCCESWIAYMQKNGYEIKVVDAETVGENLDKFKLSHGITEDTASCHTGLVGGYVVEGHVPVDVVEKLLKEKPADVVGVATPGMPLGSPGMEQGGQFEAYDVVLIKKDGSIESLGTYKGDKKIH